MPKKSKSPQSGDASSELKTGKAVSRSRSTRNKKDEDWKQAESDGKKGKNRSTPKIVRGFLPTDEEIRIRAYFIAERRSRLALPGDSSSDWLEAKRQLFSEVGPR